MLGNHEYKYVRYKKHEKVARSTNIKNPMQLNNDKQNIYYSMSDDDMKYLQDAPFFVKIDKLTILHAGITNKINLKNTDKKDLESLLRIRMLDEEQNILRLGQTTWNARFWSEWYDGSQGIIVYGHEVFDKVKIDRYSFGIDTGCVYGNKLTALIIYDTKNPMFSYDIVQVGALKKYTDKK